MEGGFESSSNDGIMLQDLRAYHSNLCGAILIKIQEAMEQDNLPVIFRLLTENLYSEIQQKLEKKEKDKYWKMLNEEILPLIDINKNKEGNYAYGHLDGKTDIRTKIKFKIYNLYWEVRSLMEKKGMFGRKDTERI